MSQGEPAEPIFQVKAFLLCGELLWNINPKALSGVNHFRLGATARGYPRTFGPPDDMLYAVACFEGLDDGFFTCYVDVKAEDATEPVYRSIYFDPEVRREQLAFAPLRLTPELNEPGLYRVRLYWARHEDAGDNVEIASTLFHLQHA